MIYDEQHNYYNLSIPINSMVNNMNCCVCVFFRCKYKNILWHYMFDNWC